MGIAAGILFWILYFIVKIGAWFSVGIGLILFILAINRLSPRAKKKTPAGELPGEGEYEDGEQIEKTLKVGKEKLFKMHLYAEGMSNFDIRRKIEDICKIVEKIFINLEEHPEDIEQAGPFLNHYLDSALGIIQKYVELKDQRIDSPEVRETLAKVESVMVTIRKAFEKQLAKLLEDDVLDLDTEVEYFKRSIKIDGLDDNK